MDLYSVSLFKEFDLLLKIMHVMEHLTYDDRGIKKKRRWEIFDGINYVLITFAHILGTGKIGGTSNPNARYNSFNK